MAVPSSIIEIIPDLEEARAAVLWYLCRDDWKGNTL
jgi:hypothetical protein